jgi:hypothetical protein
MSGQGNEGREELVPFCIKLLLMVQAVQGSRDRSIYGAVCGWFSGTLGNFATRYWIRHDGSDFWGGRVVGAASWDVDREPLLRYEGTKGTKIQP